MKQTRKPWLVVAALVAALLAGSGVAAAQETSREERLAKELLEVSSGTAMGMQVMHQMIGSFAAAFPDVPQEFWDNFAKEVDPKELEELILPIYVKHLTAEEMEAAIAFYRTPEGQSILRKMPLVVQESIQVGQQWGERLSQRVMEKLEAREDPPPEP